MKRKKPKSYQYPYVTNFVSEDGSEISDNLNGWDNLFYYFILKEEILTCDTRRLTHDLRSDPNNPLVMAGPGSVVFIVLGYDEDPRNLVQIPEFNAFVRKMRKCHPCWLYFAAAETDWILTIAVAGNKGSSIWQTDSNKLTVALNGSDFRKFLKQQTRDYAALCKMAKIKKAIAEDHLEAAITYSFPNHLKSEANG